MRKTCEMYPNGKTADYKRHVRIPISLRIQVADKQKDAARAYYNGTHIGGDGKFPTLTECSRLERLADYILADDHLLGLTILRDPYDMPRDEDVHIPPGEGAITFMNERGIRIYCEADAEALADGDRIKVCRTCRYAFKDKSRGKTKVDCSDECRSVYQKMWQRVKRYGTTDLEGERRRMKLEYPFYSPKEMESLQERSESAHGNSDKVSQMEAAKKRKDKHGTRHVVQLIDKRGTEGNKYLDGTYGWHSDRNNWKGRDCPIWWGPVVSYNLADQPLTERFVESRQILEAVNISA
ncbi:hypothetical protein AK95_07750 [Paenibacillus sp. LC231]|uniref:hypothetical protein n=1 Tax=Paenibacillus sp. LC231 TaxID=1120679 RepID=UPI0008DCBADD|nr:hypothetical protein [Paenibacillus sp. LC231]OIB03497.1 hypothetical protein AK95_07750 [Paenibacillus sp. LC231]